MPARRPQRAFPRLAGAGPDPAAHSRDSRVSLPPRLPGGHPAQLEDISREARALGGETNPMKALVTGGGGFLGSAIVRRLAARGDTVRSFARGDYPELRSLGVEVIRGDIADTNAI